MGSFLTRFVDSAARAFLLIPCLLICLSCATPFPIERLEEGMTADSVREAVGEPEAIEAEPGGTMSSWAYGYKEFDLLTTLFALPWTPFVPVLSLLPNLEWDDFYTQPTVVTLHFEEDQLARWEVIERGYGYAPGPDHGAIMRQQDQDIGHGH